MLFAVTLAACIPFIFHPLPARSEEDAWMSKVVSLQGQVAVKRCGQTEWTPLQLEDCLFSGDILHVSENSRAAIVLRNDSVLRLDQQTTLVFEGIKEKKSFLLNLIEGAAFFFSRKRHTLEVATPFVNGVVEGTEFLVQVDAEKTRVILYEGAMRAQNSHGEITIHPGQAAEARKDRPPAATALVRSRDAVQWALYYPPILALRPDDIAIQGPDHWQTRLGRSMQAYARGNLAQAFNPVEGLGDTVDDARFYAYRAGLYLSVGRIERARRDIDRALVLDARNSSAMALRSIIAVVQNRREEALADARAAVAIDTDSAAARIALSYALQSHFELTAALAEARSAVKAEPANNIAWARLAELHLSNGDLDRALEAAQKAAELPPALSHTHSILGYAYLTQIKIDRARKAFKKAIALDSAAPLPRLGLGLADIRRGDLASGRAEIEIAAGLAPDYALIRSYLGKAYFEEKRSPLDQRQFEMAKKLDPNDPTPWFYDAIRKQTENRPVEALQDLQKSIELNDNRAVYRSKLLLDEDTAARGANLGRIYNDLNFQEVALREGYKSLAIDPTNFSAHRLLADSYLYRPRMKIARVSELLQSQLLQPISTSPLQPQLAESNLYVLDGLSPGNPSFNEFGSLFNRNQTKLQFNVTGGDNSTFGSEIVGYGMWDNFSLNLGYYHFQTNGFIENNDQTRNLFSAIGKYSVSHKTAILAELRYTDINMGDLPLRFYQENNSLNLRINKLIKFIRLGLQTEINPSSNFIINTAVCSYPYDERDSVENPYPFQYILNAKEEGSLTEAQHIFSSERLKVISGIGYFTSEYESEINNSIINSSYKDHFHTIHSNIYLYSSINFPPNVIFIIGGSGDFYRRGNVNVDQLNPKLGLSWFISPKTTIRTTFFRTLKRSLVLDQTVEPTQVAGFNQFYDDSNGTDAWKYGVALDHQFNWNVTSGIEFSYRDLKHNSERSEALKGNERETRAFLSWSPFKMISFNFEYLYEKYNRDKNNAGEEQFTKLTTHRLPISVNFYNPSGGVAKLKSTFVNQSGTFAPPYSGLFSDSSDIFWVIDASIGYRLPNRFGSFNLNLLNILDRKFQFQDTDPQNPTIQPKRAIVGLLTLNF